MTSTMTSVVTSVVMLFRTLTGLIQLTKGARESLGSYPLKLPGQILVVRELINLGVNVLAFDDYGATAADAAETGGHIKIARELRG
jgi:hypothetical protein